MRLQIEGENDEQTPGDIYEEGIREAITQRREFIPQTVAGSMPQALQSRQPIIRSLQIADLLENRPIPSPLALQPSSPPAAPPFTSTPQETREQEDNPDARAVRRGVDSRLARARQQMANQYEKRGEVVEFEAGDYCTIKVPKKDRPSGATTMRILARILRRCGHLYEIQTKYGILHSRYGAQNLNRIDQCTAEEDGKELGNNRRKISLRYAAKASHTGSSKRKRIYCGCAGDCHTARCVCHKNGVGCTIYCHKRSGECPNKATGSSYTQIAVIEQDEDVEMEE
jgi:hypothetical protein